MLNHLCNLFAMHLVHRSRKSFQLDVFINVSKNQSVALLSPVRQEPDETDALYSRTVKMDTTT